MSDYVRASASWRFGIWHLRVRSRLWFVKASWSRPLFSERNGLGVVVLLSARGWRFGYRVLNPLPAITRLHGGES